MLDQKTFNCLKIEKNITHFYTRIVKNDGFIDEEGLMNTYRAKKGILKKTLLKKN